MKIQIIKYFKQLSITRKVILILITILVIGYIFCLPRQLFHVPYSTVVTDRNGELLGARIASDGQWRFPPRTTTPEKIKQCLITFEDRHFYHHWGVNPVSISRAAYQNLKWRKYPHHANDPSGKKRIAHFWRKVHRNDSGHPT